MSNEKEISSGIYVALWPLKRWELHKVKTKTWNIILTYILRLRCRWFYIKLHSKITLYPLVWDFNSGCLTIDKSKDISNRQVLSKTVEEDLILFLWNRSFFCKKINILLKSKVSEHFFQKIIVDAPFQEILCDDDVCLCLLSRRAPPTERCHLWCITHG